MNLSHRTVHSDGDLLGARAEVLRAAFEETRLSIRPVQAVVVDLGSALRIDSHGLQALADEWRTCTARGVFFAVAGARGAVLAALRASRLDQRFGCYETPEQALAEAGRPPLAEAA